MWARLLSPLLIVTVVAGCADNPAGSLLDPDAGTPDASTIVDAGRDADPIDATAAADASGEDAAIFTDAATGDAAPPADAFLPPDAQVGPFADAAPGCPAESLTEICSRVSANCGTLSTFDTCGTSRTVDCGSCVAGSLCGAGGAPNVCAACASETDSVFCTRLGKSCGSVSGTDNCGASRTASCGICGGGELCSASNVCGCVAESNGAFCTRLAKDCGSVADVDNCGVSRIAACGSCNGSSTCGGGGLANVCGVAPVCAPPATTPTYAAVLPQAGPASFHQSACTLSQSSAFVTDCFGRASAPSACSAWKSANSACAACVLTPSTAAALGPIVSYAADVDAASNPLGTRDDSFFRGVQACLDHHRSGCGAAFLSLDRCLEASCDPSVACSDPSALSACRTSASSGVCATANAAAFDTGVGACRGVLSVSASFGAVLPADTCVPFAGELDTDVGSDAFVTRLVTTFCGP
jgi:hypothetical protein